MTQFRILVVEDEIIVRMVLNEMLTDLGCEVVQAATGEEGAAHLAEGSFDLLFTDVRLPGALSGLDMAEMARAKMPGIPVIIASGATADLKEKLASLEPPPVVMPKPYNFAALMTLVRGMMPAA
ncbi:response regulator [Acetobacteraceae bacterium H6797]|nr:response regulator [Acetobacteraceae bacterium H6797]